MYLLLLIPLFAIMATMYTVHLLYVKAFEVIKNKENWKPVLTSLFGQIQVQELAHQPLREIDFEGDFSKLLDQQLDKLILSIKGQIPPAAMFLTPSLSDKFKEIARVELLQMVPEVRRKISMAIDRTDLENFIYEKISSINWDAFKEPLEPALKRANYLAILIGAGFGFLQLAVALITHWMNA